MNLIEEGDRVVIGRPWRVRGADGRDRAPPRSGPGRGASPLREGARHHRDAGGDRGRTHTPRRGRPRGDVDRSPAAAAADPRRRGAGGRSLGRGLRDRPGGAEIAIGPLGIDCAYPVPEVPVRAPRPLPDHVQQARPRPDREPEEEALVVVLDVSLVGSYWGAERVYHHTAPVSAVYGLAAGLGLLLEEGLAARQRRHREVAHSLWAGLRALGLDLLVDEPLRTPMITSVKVPDGIDEQAVRRRLREVHGSRSAAASRSSRAGSGASVCSGTERGSPA